jgi:DHA1 family bicyclomycin/chloramphenicol resistance-like MFS transporter
MPDNQKMSSSKRSNFFIILILGALSTVTPFAIDMYLPAFPQMATDLQTTAPKIAFSLSSYLVGMAIGQIFYGPLLDRFGRKPPLYFGLLLFIATSLGCILSGSVESLIVFRFLQALGGCAAQVAAVAMVRDFFPAEERTKVFSLLVLILGASPLLAPTVGSFVAVSLGWQWVFIILAGIIALLLAVVFFFLPEGHEPDKSVSLKIKPILSNFAAILKEPQFYTYALTNALSFGCLLVYVAASPIIFMDSFKVDARTFGGIFALLSIGIIGGSQVNLLLSRWYASERILQVALFSQCVVAVIFLAGTITGSFGLVATIILFFALLSCIGILTPNATALALAPFGKNAGSASALIGFLQIGTGALASSGVGLFNSGNSLPAISILTGMALLALLILTVGKRKIIHKTTDEELNASIAPAH